MEIKLIKTEKDYNQALLKLEEIFDTTETKKKTMKRI
ncbi:hypothetical protein SAMN06265379_105140 [Saccharicrinis carchari]|uniref:Uncharacterized protein n=1 Tax=Saccharicrinis carchari TaxID=1168039 RepID=A0A521DF03_SACCC|nr:hypothetical protein SAMN06265379_105140 [Saccharicrinis carchari]